HEQYRRNRAVAKESQDSELQAAQARRQGVLSEIPGFFTQTVFALCDKPPGSWRSRAAWFWSVMPGRKNLRARQSQKSAMGFRATIVALPECASRLRNIGAPSAPVVIRALAFTRRSGAGQLILTPEIPDHAHQGFSVTVQAYAVQAVAGAVLKAVTIAAIGATSLASGSKTRFGQHFDPGGSGLARCWMAAEKGGSPGP
nr:hypothetical protein [Tanacetum cinerariifolium]